MEVKIPKLFLEELEQVIVQSLFLCVRQSVRATRVNFQFTVRNQLHHLVRTRLNGYNLVIVSLDNEDWNVHALQVLRMVCLPGSDTIERGFEAGLHSLLEPGIDETLAYFGAWSIESEKGTCWDVPEELSAVFDHSRPKTIEHRQGNAVWALLGLD